MNKPEFLLYDTKDDRREIHRQIDSLSPANRLEFLHWCCKQVFLPNTKICPRPSRRMLPMVEEAKRDTKASDMLTNSIFFDFWTLANQYKLDVTKAANELERRAKGRT